MHVHPTVDADGLAGHEIAVVGGEEDDGAHQVCGILIALDGVALSAVGQLLWTRDAFLVCDRDGQAGHDGVHVNVVAALFAGECAVEADERGMRRDIVKKTARLKRMNSPN